MAPLTLNLSPPPPPMQPRTPSLAILTSLLLLTASDFAVAQINAPNCSLSESWVWMFNSLGQDVCTVAAYMMGTCNNGWYTIEALGPGNWYTVSVSNGVAVCQCNMVVYNLLSACGACQGGDWTTWLDYSYDCIPPLMFPNPVPSGTSVPQWALVDNTFQGNWYPNTSFAVDINSEMGPGSLIGIPTFGTSSGNGKNTAVIAGSVAGGGVVLVVIGALLFYFLWKRQHSQAPSAATAADDGETPPLSEEHPPLSRDEAYVPKTPVAPMRFYDPNDPSTFPKYQRVPTSTQDVHVPVSSKDRGPNGSRPRKVQATFTPGYHGLPIV